MKTHEIELAGYRAVCVDSPVLQLGTTDSYGVEQLHICPDELWKTLAITAVFTNGPVSTEVPVTADGCIAVPPEATAHTQQGTLWGRIVFRGSDAEKRILSADLPYRLEHHAPAEGDNSITPTENQFAQFVAAVGQAADRAEAAADRAEAVGEADPTIIREVVYNYLDENPVQPTPIDMTLTQAGQAADAKAAGDALRSHTDSETAHSDLRTRLAEQAEQCAVLQEQVAGQEIYMQDNRAQIHALEESKQPAGHYLTVESDPAGYGLGSAVWISDGKSADALQSNGWYAWDTDGLSGTPFSSGYMLVAAQRAGKYITQFAFNANYTGTGSTQIAVRTYGSTAWNEWEWLSPPMAVGVEYRTTERWLGQPVYTTVADCGTAAVGSTQVDTGIACSKILRISGQAGGYALPFINSTLDNAYSIWARVYNNSGKIRVSVSANTSSAGLAVMVQIWYTKS